MQYFIKKTVLILGLWTTIGQLEIPAEIPSYVDHVQLIAQGKKRNFKKRYLVMDFIQPYGMFACLGSVMGHLDLHDKDMLGLYAGFAVDFKEYGAYYSPAYGPNWWEYYFEPIRLGSLNNAKVSSFSEKQLNRAFWARCKLTRERGKYLIDKYIKIKKDILDEVDSFVKTSFGNSFILGVHFRGTDKCIVECPRLPYNAAIMAVVEQTNALKDQDYKIFVATDEQGFLDAVQERFPGKVILADAIRSSDGSSLHNNTNHDPYLVGKQALIDAILLAKSNLLIRTSSNLSMWSTYYNPKMPVVQLNFRHDGFPE